MNRVVLIVTFILLAFVLESAAQFNETRFVIGVDGGPSVGKYRGSLPSDAEFSSHLGFGLGIDLEIGFSSHVYLKTGVLYEAKGPGVSVAIVDAAGTFIQYTDSWLRHSYTVIPLMLNYRFGSKIYGTISAGGYYGNLLGVNQIIDETPFTDEISLDVSEEYRSHDFGFAGALGLEFPITASMWVSAEIRGHHGLSHMDVEDLENEEDRTTLSSTLLLTGLKYRIGE